MRLKCHDCGAEFDTRTKQPFSNHKTMQPGERYHTFCSVKCQANAEKKVKLARLNRPHLATVNGHQTDDYATVNTKAERLF